MVGEDMAKANMEGHNQAAQEVNNNGKLLVVIIAVLGVVAVVGWLGLGKLGGMGAGQNQCSEKYTSCVLSCNRKTVEYSQKSEESRKPKVKKKWESMLANVQSTCIPGCYKTHCTKRTKK